VRAITRQKIREFCPLDGRAVGCGDEDPVYFASVLGLTWLIDTMWKDSTGCNACTVGSPPLFISTNVFGLLTFLTFLAVFGDPQDGPAPTPMTTSEVLVHQQQLRRDNNEVVVPAPINNDLPRRAAGEAVQVLEPPQQAAQEDDNSVINAPMANAAHPEPIHLQEPASPIALIDPFSPVNPYANLMDNEDDVMAHSMNPSRAETERFLGAFFGDDEEDFRMSSFNATAEHLNAVVRKQLQLLLRSAS
jgi:hypothetical protein